MVHLKIIETSPFLGYVLTYNWGAKEIRILTSIYGFSSLHII